MSVVNAGDMLWEASVGKYAVGAFNITSIVQMKAIVDAAVQNRSPLILQTSVIVAQFYRPEVIVAVYRAMAGSASVPICLHLDHCRDPKFGKACADAGYTNIMIDGSHLPLDDNVRLTREMCRYCHRRGITVEAELGALAGTEDQNTVRDEDARLCIPEEAERFIALTGADTLAPAIGTAHGEYKGKTPKIDFERLAKIKALADARPPGTPLAIHGGTGLESNVVRAIVAAGGAKFNVATELKRALIDTTYEYIRTHRSEYDPGSIDAEVQKITMHKVSAWMDLLGCSGRASN
jgi:tagatose 1,6-diphosphate aldolase GatY/KbaY